MPRQHVIRPFRPFHLQQHPLAQDPIYRDIQEYVYYVEARVRAIIAAILVTPQENRQWMQLYLQTELFVVTGYIGIMTAIGRVVDIPIVIRTMVDGLVMVKENFLPVSFDSDFIQIIEAGTGEGFGKVVESYHLQWWTEAEEPGEEWLLTKDNIVECIEHYEEQLEAEKRKQLAVRIVANPQLPSTKRRMESGEDGGARSAAFELIASHSTNQLKILLNSVNGQRRASEAKVQLAARRTATLYLLLESILHKEMADTPTPGPIPKGKKSLAALMLSQKSKFLFLAGKNAIPDSQQWTFGTVLTRNEVLGLVHKSFQELHTGYNTTHEWESLSGQDSAGGVANDIELHISVGENNECAAEARRPLPENTVPARSAKFHPQRPRLVLPDDNIARLEYLKGHPEEEEELARQWSNNNAQWDQHGKYIGITHQIPEGAAQHADSNIASTNDDISLGALNSPTSSGNMAALFDVLDIVMSSPTQDQEDISMADFFSNSSIANEDFDPTSLAALFDSDANTEDDLDPASLADLFGSDTGESDRDQSFSSDASNPDVQRPHTFSAADFLYVTEETFEEENLMLYRKDSDTD